jgi:hypothetical protein
MLLGRTKLLPVKLQPKGHGGGGCIHLARNEPLALCYEHGNEYLESRKGGEFCGQLSQYQLYKRDSVPESYFACKDIIIRTCNNLQVWLQHNTVYFMKS